MMIKPAKITHSMLLDMAKRAICDHERTIFLHYTWGAYGDIYDEFHLCIDKNGEIQERIQDPLELKKAIQKYL